MENELTKSYTHIGASFQNLTMGPKSPLGSPGSYLVISSDIHHIIPTITPYETKHLRTVCTLNHQLCNCVCYNSGPAE